MLDMSHEDLNNDFDRPTRVLLSLLAAREVTRVSVASAANDNTAYEAHFTAEFENRRENHMLCEQELTQAMTILQSVETAHEDGPDRIKAIEQILRTTYQHLNQAKQVGLMQADIPVWYLQPYCRDFDVHPAPES